MSPRASQAELSQWGLAGGLVAASTLVTAYALPLKLHVTTELWVFLSALVLIGLFDVWLPHGDSTEAGAAIAITMLLVTTPAETLIAVTLARVAVHVLRFRFTQLLSLANNVARRAVAITVAGLLLAGLRTPSASVSELPADVLVAAVFVLVDLLLAQYPAAIRKRQSVFTLLVGNVRFQGAFLAAQASVGLLAALLHPRMAAWGIALTAVLLLALRQSFSLLLDIRQAYSTTIEALAEAVEIGSPTSPGHAGRVAELSRAIGIRVGLSGQDLESLSYAALLHDVDLIGAGGSVPGPTGDYVPSRAASEVLSGIHSLRSVRGVLELCDGKREPALGSRSQRMSAYIVCRASNIDSSMQADKGDTFPVDSYSGVILDTLLDGQERQAVENAITASLDRLA